MLHPATICYEVVIVHSCQHQPRCVVESLCCNPIFSVACHHSTPGTTARPAEFRTVLSSSATRPHARLLPPMHRRTLPSRRGGFKICFSDLCAARLRSSTPILHNTMQELPRNIPIVSLRANCTAESLNLAEADPSMFRLQPSNHWTRTRFPTASALAHTLQSFANSHDLLRDHSCTSSRSSNSPLGSVCIHVHDYHCCLHEHVHMSSNDGQRRYPALLRHARFWAFLSDVHVKGSTCPQPSSLSLDSISRLGALDD